MSFVLGQYCAVEDGDLADSFREGGVVRLLIGRTFRKVVQLWRVTYRVDTNIRKMTTSVVAL